MLGAIIGDIAGSRWEFSPTHDYAFELFSESNDFTDDTICTVAVAEALLHGRDYGENIHEWCRRYPHPMGGYGGRFAQWVRSDHPQPYGSFGNGSAMRVSPVAWFFSNLETVREEAAKTARCTHNHPEGVKGAQSVAEAIFRFRRLHDPDPEHIRRVCEEICASYGYDLAAIREERVRNRFDETCQGTVPVAFWIIAQSTDFEDAVRRAVSLGADADTLGAIVGSIAETIWPVPAHIADRALAYLPSEMKTILQNFSRR